MTDNSTKERTKRPFDYQERWHGWGSPVGLGLFILSVAGALFLLSAGLGLFLVDIS